MFPQYTCSDGNVSWQCSREEFCFAEEEVFFTPDYSERESLYNFIWEFDAHCISGFELGLFGGMYFLGFILGSQLLSGIADIFGRMGAFRRFYFTAALGAGLVYFAPNLN